MSYVKRGATSDLYMYGGALGPEPDDTRHVVVCAGCWLINPGADTWDEPVVFYTLNAVTQHIYAHMDAGHKVPFSLIPQIERDGWIH
jgi:hypothetical protein